MKIDANNLVATAVDINQDTASHGLTANIGADDGGLRLDVHGPGGGRIAALSEAADAEACGLFELALNKATAIGTPAERLTTCLSTVEVVMAAGVTPPNALAAVVDFVNGILGVQESNDWAALLVSDDIVRVGKLEVGYAGIDIFVKEGYLYCEGMDGNSAHSGPAHVARAIVNEHDRWSRSVDMVAAEQLTAAINDVRDADDMKDAIEETVAVFNDWSTRRGLKVSAGGGSAGLGSVTIRGGHDVLRTNTFDEWRASVRRGALDLLRSFI